MKYVPISTNIYVIMSLSTPLRHHLEAPLLAEHSVHIFVPSFMRRGALTTTCIGGGMGRCGSCWPTGCSWSGAPRWSSGRWKGQQNRQVLVVVFVDNNGNVAAVAGVAVDVGIVLELSCLCGDPAAIF